MSGNRTPEAVVTENLKSLKLLHQILIVASAAVLAFALRPDFSNDYRLALDELSALREISFDGWSKFITDRYKAKAERNDKFVQEVVHLAGLNFQGHPKLDQPIYGEQPPYIGTAKLIDFDGFLSRTAKIGAIRFDADKPYVAEQLKQAVSARHAHPVVTQVWLDGIGQVTWIRMIDSRSAPTTSVASLDFGINDQPQTVPNTPVHVLVPYTIDFESGPFAKEWLTTDTFGRKLIDRKTDTIFPNLKEFWAKVNSLTAEQAIVFQEDQVESNTHGAISFFGIPVERDLAICAGPAVCFAILLFLCLHLRHIHFVGTQDGVVALYPWVPLFRGIWALGVTYVTVLVLPVAANVLLLVRFGNLTDWSTRVGAILFFLMLAVAISTLIEIHRLRRQCLSS
jgi:hypothetical protein